MTSGALGLALLVACDGDDDPEGSDAVDHDHDGFVAPLDCDDGDGNVHPGAIDLPYDGVDADCAGDSDHDADGDGVDVGLDCDDRDPDVHPGAVEVCNGRDDDCVGGRDGPDAVDIGTWYPDRDGDGVGTAGDAIVDCVQPPSTSERSDDCDDADPGNLPGNAERCDRRDNDCDGSADEDLPTTTSWPDADGDGAGDATAAEVLDCLGVPSGHVANADDCDDARPTVFPGAPAVACDGFDNDCDPNTAEAGGVTVQGVPAASLETALAGAPAGAYVTVCEGRYVGPGLVIGTPITLVGAGSGVTVLDGGGAGPALTIDADAVVISGLRLEHGTGRDDGGGTTQGGGLWIRPGASVDAADVSVVGNVAGQGAGIWVGADASLVLAGGAVTDNTADPGLAFTVALGGGLWAGDRAVLELDAVEVARNTADACGGLAIGDGAALDGHATTLVLANEDDGLGGGGMCAGRGVAVTDLFVGSNHASNSGGGITAAGGTLTRVTVSGNSADLAGGGLYAEGLDDLRLVDCVVEGNTAGVEGGGLFVNGSVVVEGGAVRDDTETFFGSSGGGAEVAPTGVLESIGAEWRGNVDADVGVGAGVFTFGGAADFVCDGATESCR